MAWPCLWPAITTIAVYMMVVHGPVSNHLVQKDHAERVEVAKRVARKSGMVMLLVVVVGDGETCFLFFCFSKSRDGRLVE